MKTKRNQQINAAVIKTAEKTLHRIAKHTITAALNDMAVEIQPPVVVEIGGKNISQNFNNQYGILPFAMNASPDELMAIAKQLEQAKYILTEKGDFYSAWKAGYRQRVLLGVLSGMTTFKLHSV